MRRFWLAFWRALQELSGEAALKRALDDAPTCCAGRASRAEQVARELDRRFSGVNRCC